ncbi:hypothetical protein SGGMMB4_02755 [Sodalis glossinidius str. 'morsitans']|uniref:Hypothetical phage protein n=1 Tax=Sodalis glossinidius (strain morsitans) TaxID=343509 RepID=Q2NTM8_SODGM|nr:DUF669 domain-containing protein [Sodalis glossinidius]BAE74497.1 hypothetical phage protein [Sodalis glossinidius str. 'morsitans']CRL45198.1 hypothetical protein SGGMMB4_02755 [Sodalis glossinidius str. 'morsitans']
MNNVTFIYNQEAALAAGQSGFITESGAYVVTILEAKYMTSQSGAESIEFSVENEDGKKANYINIYCQKKDKTPNKYGINMINAIMGCIGVQQLTTKMIDAHTHLAPELTGQRIGLVLQKMLKTKSDGKETHSLDIMLPFAAQTRQTLEKKIKNLPAQAIDKQVATLQDKDERKQSPRGYEQQETSAPDSDIPF